MNEERTTLPLPEKWFDVLLVRVGDRRRAREIRREISGGPPPELFGVTDVEKTGFEERVTAASAAALRSYLAARGLSGRPVAPGRVHLLTPEEYAGKIGRDGPDGLTMYGHVYVQRTDHQAKLIHMITHEMVHQAAFLSLRVLPAGDPSTGEVITRSQANRGGLVTFRRSDPLRPEFQGLNEAATELIAHDVRREFLDLFGPLDEATRDRVLCFWAYSCACLLTNQLIRLVSDARGVDADLLLRRDYFLGTSDFLTALRKTMPRAPPILRSMDGTTAAVLAAARRLGFNAIAERIVRMSRPASPAGG